MNRFLYLFMFPIEMITGTSESQSWFKQAAKLQNTRPLVFMSPNKNSVYYVMPRSSKPLDTCK